MNESERIEMMRALAGELPAGEREAFERDLERHAKTIKEKEERLNVNKGRLAAKLNNLKQLEIASQQHIARHGGVTGPQTSKAVAVAVARQREEVTRLQQQIDQKARVISSEEGRVRQMDALVFVSNRTVRE